MKISQIFESDVPTKGQTSVGTKFLTYKSIKRGNIHLISVSSRSKPIGSIKIERFTIQFNDKDGLELLSIRNTYGEIDETAVESMINTLVEVTGIR